MGEAQIYDLGHDKRMEEVEFIAGLYSENGIVPLTSQFAKVALRNPFEAAAQLPEFIEQKRDTNRFAESVAGGPNQDEIVPLFNILGYFYPDMSVDERALLLRPIQQYLYSLNYLYGQEHVALINKPWLVAELVTNNKLLFPGCRRQAEMLVRCNSVEELHEHLGDLRGGVFFLLYAILNGYAIESICRYATSQLPLLWNRTLDAAAWMIQAYLGGDMRYTLEQSMQRIAAAYRHDVAERIGKRARVKLQTVST